MCGLAGLVRFAGLRPAECAAGALMAATLSHRGPDGQGHFADHWASLGHARLSIIDLPAGGQPMANEDGRVQVVFNGEIHNHRELAERLRARGHLLRTHCDTEVIAHLYEDFGEGFVEELNGMFAIAVWDVARRRLVLARDRLGIKPLYWSDDGLRVAFGSELKAVLAGLDEPLDPDPKAIQDYLAFGHVPAPGTIYRGIRKLEPGCIAVCTEQGSAVRRYWDIPAQEEVPEAAARGREAELAEQFAALLADSVRLRLEADVPLGAFLSGGVDSTAVVAAMRQCGNGAVLTHTVGFEEADHDERQAAAAIARRLGTDHRELVVRADAAGAATRLIAHFDEPFADPCAVPTYYLSQVARSRVTVALSGDGPDEYLAGYRRYRFDLAEHAVRSIAPAWLRGSAGLAGRLYPTSSWLPRPLRAGRTLQNLACDEITAHLRSVCVAGGSLPQALLRPEVLGQAAGHDSFDRGRDLYARSGGCSLLGRLCYVDTRTLLADEILTKVDRASMAVGLEVRPPLLDHRLVEFAARLPVSMKLAGSQGKRVLRQTVARWLGAGFSQPPKRGFDVPTDAWFRGPLRSMAMELTEPGAACSDWLDPSAVRRLVRHHLSGRVNGGQSLWAVLMLELWARQSRPMCGLASRQSLSLCGQGRLVTA